MDVKLHKDFQGNALARDSASAIEACVHCGFCLATCPTYLLTRDERDSPRGRIYLVKNLLESGEASERAQHHLDRCLTCKSCETSCPSGVQYGEILNAGRAILEERVSRPPVEALKRWLLRFLVPRKALFNPLLRCAQLFAPLLPATLRQQVPDKQSRQRLENTDSGTSSVILLDGCVQEYATPNTNDATAQLLDALGLRVVSLRENACCGAIDAHLGAHQAALDRFRRNIDGWWPAIESDCEAIISTATGCGAQLKDYGKALAHDPVYAERARRVSELCGDLSVCLEERIAGLPPAPPETLRLRIAVQVPCSQTHVLGHPDSVRSLLRARGFELTDTQNDHLCCGSAGTYSLLQPELSETLRQHKVLDLTGASPDLIVSANVGCQLHLAQTSPVPVKHWAELLRDTLPGR
ncbi:MAG: glycolate oxidase subunit GlcF [Congregibacter sp.]